MKNISKFSLLLFIFTLSIPNYAVASHENHFVKDVSGLFDCNGLLFTENLVMGTYDLSNYPVRLDPNLGIVVDVNNNTTDEFIPMGFGMNNDVLTMAVDSKGNVYVGGKFSKIGDLKVHHAAKWDGAKWSSISKDGFNDDVRSIAIDKTNAGDKVYFVGIFSKANNKSADRFYSLYDDSDLSVSLDGDPRSIAVDNKHNIHIAGVYRHGFRGKRDYYLTNYINGSWKSKTIKDHIDMNGEQEIKILCASNTDVIVSAPKNGVYRVGGTITNIKKLSDKSNMRVTNITMNPISETIYFAIRNTKKHSSELFAFKKGSSTAQSVWSSNDIEALSISIGSSGHIMYMGGGEHSKINLIKLNLSDENNITSTEIKRIYKKNKKDAGNIYALAIPNQNDVIVGGDFQNINQKMEAKNIVLYRQNIKIKENPLPALEVKSMYVGGKESKLVEGTVLTIEGAVSISSADITKPYAIGPEYLDDYLLWVEDGIVTEELSFAAPEDWSDYVLEDDYDLMNLKKLKKFIEKNGHLPGIPSEKEIIEKGYSVHDMNKRFMAKIEELVLYAIQLEEHQIEESKWNLLIQKELEDLKSKIQKK